MGFFRQEYWSELPFPSPGDLSDPGIEPVSLLSPALAARFFIISATWEAPWASLEAQMVKRLPAMQEMWVPSLGQEDPLEEGLETHSSILAWRVLWIEEPSRLQSIGLYRAGHD